MVATAVRLGQFVKDTYPTWFDGCQCNNDLVHVMNRWSSPPGEEKIARIALALKNKGKIPSNEESLAVSMLKETIDSYFSEGRSQVTFLSEPAPRIDVAKRYSPKSISKMSAIHLNYMRDKVPEGCVVITAADQPFLRGAYMLAWTLLRATDVRLIVYDLGLDHGCEMVAAMKSWGVEFRQWEPEVRRVRGWQTFNKPMMIRAAMEEFESVLWLDSDIAIARSISPAFDYIRERMLVPDHGSRPRTKNANSQLAKNLIGKSKKHWGLKGTDWPCAGIVGVTKRDTPIIDEWIEIIRKLKSIGGLCEPTFYDQGVLQEIFDGELADGRIWNSLQVMRQGGEKTLMQGMYAQEHVVCHYGGVVKPWSTWRQSLDWGNPVSTESPRCWLTARPVQVPPSNGHVEKIESFVALTSLATHEHHLARQTVSLNSWKEWGLDIVVRNTTHEIHELKSRYPQVDRWIADDQVPVSYAKPTQRIYNLCYTAVEIGKPVFLINSDCEIYGKQSILLDLIEDKSLVAAIRWETVKSDYARAERELWGIDSFLITPEMAETLPAMDFAIGRPMWDYWIPCHFMSLGYKMKFVGEPLVFHEKHELNWSQQELDMAANWLHSMHYSITKGNAEKFRKKLPFPPAGSVNG